KLAVLDGLFATTPTGRNAFEGYHTQRIYAVFGKTRAFDDLAVHPLLLGALDHALGPYYQFSAPVALQIGPGGKGQVLHRDEGVYPRRRRRAPDCPETNAATRLIPGSDRWPEDRQPDEREVGQATMPAGSVLIYHG